MIPAELKRRIEGCRTLPTPPGVAVQIVAFANDPNADIDQIVKVLAVDPAITAKIMRIANSSMYAMQRKSQNLRQATLVLGLDATISLALSFSLLKSWQIDTADGGLDYRLFWRRALLAATASQVLANVLRLKDGEELFLTALIQDIGMMALDQIHPDLYVGIGSEVDQETLIARERERLGVDHAEIGSWLLKSWNFPERIQQAVAGSHDPSRRSSSDADGASARCVALASLIAEVFLDAPDRRDFQLLADRAQRSFAIDREGIHTLIDEVSRRIPDAEAIFQTEILGPASTESILEEAREALIVHNLRALRTVSTLMNRTESLERRTKQLEEGSRRDPMTGLYSRTFLDAFIQEAFEGSCRLREPLSVAFADLDGFKGVNDTYGHAAGDQILVTTAQILQASVRATDVVARYGGEEFVLVFPDTDHAFVKVICERIVKALRDTRHDVGEAERRAVTISVGMATHNDGRTFSTSQELIAAADKALYAAKMLGRDRSVPYESEASGQIAYLSAV